MRGTSRGHVTALFRVIYPAKAFFTLFLVNSFHLSALGALHCLKGFSPVNNCQSGTCHNF